MDKVFFNYYEILRRRNIEPPPIFNSLWRRGSKYYGGEIMNPLLFLIPIGEGVKNIRAAKQNKTPPIFNNGFKIKNFI